MKSYETGFFRTSKGENMTRKPKLVAVTGCFGRIGV